MGETLWILEAVEDSKFPYRLSIKRDEHTLLCLRVQDHWPGQKGNIFCIREEQPNWPSPSPSKEIERVPIISMRRYGKRLVIVLDRIKNKRCDFLFLKKAYKTREGEYEQIFWRTQQALKQRRPRVKLTTYGSYGISIIIDINERYPWRFPDCDIKKSVLPVGDYALKEGHGIIALVERKTFDNLIAEFGRMPSFHQQLTELEAYMDAALVIEANYSDFLNPKKLKFYPPSFASKAIAELHALHPRLNIVFAGNRKLAQEWTLRFFQAVKSHEKDVPHPKIAEVVSKYGSPPQTRGGSYYRAKGAIEEMPERFTISMLRGKCPDIPESTLRMALREMKKEGRLITQNKGIRSYYKKIKD